jgi:hypothetical protein
MKLSKLFVLVFFLPSLSQAADSSWLLCDDGNLALNLLEHRKTGDTRETSLRLMLGEHSCIGILDNINPSNINSGNIFLRGNSTRFKGYIAIDYTKKIVDLIGNLRLFDSNYPVKTKLKCKELQSSI